MPHRDNRDPEVLGKMIRERARMGGLRLSEAADLIDQGTMGDALCHPAFLNGKTHMRLPVAPIHR